jgi:hypothetical protein
MKAPAKRSAPRKTLNAANLTTLGAERLATLLMEVSDGQAAIKRRLRLELAAEAGPADLAGELDKRLAGLAEKRTRISWRRQKEFVRELASLRAAIAGRLAEQDATLALELNGRLLALADAVMARVSDSKGEVEQIFQDAVDDMGVLARAAKPAPMALAERVYEAMTADSLGLAGGMAAAALPALDAAALAWLRQRLTEAMNRRARTSHPLRRAIQQIADAQGDVDGFIESWTDAERSEPLVGAQIGARLTAAGRLDEAGAALKASRPRGPVRTRGTADWETARLALLDAQGRGEEAQEMRWAGFEERLDVEMLRAFLKRLPDFDDVEAEDRAMAFARTYPNANQALRFFTQWPNVGEAAALVLDRQSDIKGDAHEILEPAVRMLEARSPLAAALLLRTMVHDTALFRRHERYRDAERQLLEAASLEPQITDHGPWGTHEDYLKRLASIRRF